MRYIMMVLAATLFSGLAVSGTTGEAGGNQNIQVMVLGTWHFGGSKSDIISVETDSVLSPQKQSELEEVARRLAAFKPTVIVTERITSAPDYIDPKYLEYTPADLATNENERVQIAYRLASMAGVSRVVGLDEQPTEGEPDYFPFDTVMAHIAASGRQAEMDALINSSREQAEKEMKHFSSLTMSEALVEANGESFASPDFYYQILEFDSGEDQPGAELNAYWFMRNAKIFAKLIDVTKPGDRVIVVFGAGHKFWLEHLAEHTPGFKVVDPVDFLQTSK